MEERSYFRSVFNSVFNRFKRLFGYEDHHSKLSDLRHEGFFKLNVGADFLKQLGERCADSNFILPEGFETVIEIPVSMGKQLYAACIQSIIEDEEDQSEILAELKNQHEEFKNKLKNLQKSHVLKELLPKTLNNSDADLDNSLDGSRRHIFFPDLREFVYQCNATEQMRSGPVNFVQNYRDQAKHHFKENERLFKMANKCLKSQDAMADNYFEQASQHLRDYERASEMAFEILLENCFKTISNHDCVDLHGFTVKEAISVLNDFLDENIDELIEDEWSDVKTVMVITGKGKHSADGIPRIKLAVCKRLKERGLRYSATNPGLLQIKLNSYSNYSADVDEY